MLNHEYTRVNCTRKKRRFEIAFVAKPILGSVISPLFSTFKFLLICMQIQMKTLVIDNGQFGVWMECGIGIFLVREPTKYHT